MTTIHRHNCSPADIYYGQLKLMGSNCQGAFTSLVEKRIFSFAPSILLLLCIPFCLYALSGASVKTVPSYMDKLKFLATTTFAILQLVLLIFWFIGNVHRSPVSLVSALLSVIAALAICILSWIEHRRSIRPSTLLSVYLLCSLVLDIPSARTLFLSSETAAIIAPLFVAGMGTKLVLLILEAQSKTSYLKDPFSKISPEARAGFLNRAIFWWINALMIAGYRRSVAYDDLPVLDFELASKHLQPKMQAAWEERAKSRSAYALLFAVLRCFQWPLLSVVFPRICLIALKYAQPFLINSAIHFVSEVDYRTENNINASRLIVAAIFIYVGIAIDTALYKHMLNRIMTMFRCAMVGLVYQRSLSLPDGLHEESAAITLMSTDVDIICDAIPTVYELWAQIIEVMIGFGLLWRQLGWVSMVPLLIVALCSRTSTEMGKKMGSKQKIWTGAVQKRVSMTASMLGSIKSLKIMGLSEFIQTSIQAQRLQELDLSKKFRWIVVLLNMIGNFVPVFAPALTFITYAVQAKLRGLEPLTPQLAFTSLALLSMLTGPATRLLFIVPTLASSSACFERLQKFLLSPSWEDHRHARETKIHAPSGSNGMVRESQPAQSPSIDLEPAILIQNATLRPSPTAEPVLNNLNIRLEKTSITIIAGPIGSGKSTLLRTIIGELPCQGDILISTPLMAYCAQTPWLVNESILNNVCGLRELSLIDEAWYDSVMHACALDEDIKLLPEGDRTVIGSRGLTLSGGQKQRLALARAIYSNLDIVILDDVLSALDSTTQSLIIERLLGPVGIFRKLGTTVVLATHATQLFHLADHIVVLGTDGSIAQQGTYESLRSQTGYIGNLLLKSVATNRADTKPSEGLMNKALKGPSNDEVLDLTRKIGDFSVYKYWLRSMSVPGTVLFITSAGIYSFFLAFSQYWLKWWTEDDGSGLITYASIYVVLSVGASLFESITISWVLLFIGPNSAAKLHFSLLRTVMRAPLSFFSENDTGVTLNKFSQDMSLIDRVLPVSAMNVVIQGFKVLAQGVLLLSVNKYMSATVPFCLVVVYFIQRVYLETSRQLRIMDLEYRSPLYSHFLETLEGLPTIRAFGWQRQFVETNIKRLDISQQPFYIMFCLQRWLNLALDLLIAALAIIVITLAVNLRGKTTGGEIGIALNVILVFNAVLLRLIETWTQMETSLGAIARLKNLDATTVSEDKPGEDCLPPADWPQRGCIEFKDITAIYGSNMTALKGISLTIAPGQRLGICGRTGSGKSSLLLTLLRLLDLQSGTILIDGCDLRTIPREIIRNRLVAIPQDPFILSDTIRTNIDPSGTLPDDLLISTLTKVHLWTTISARGGLDAQMKAQPLSQGQQQLFCLAKAMLRDSKVLVLDEATSNLDGESERWIQEVIKEEFRVWTVVMVAHRMESVLDVDLVAVLDKGVLVEIGEPTELLGREGGIFRGLNGIEAALRYER